VFSIGLNIVLYNDTIEQIQLNHHQEQPVFIWNDDHESIPVDGTPIMLEFTSNDTVYIGPLEPNPAEYQFTTTDDSISIQDFDRYVGTVKLEGQLKQLIDQDNE